MLQSDERGHPGERGAVEGTEYDFRRPRAIGATKLDHAFTDLEREEDGLARVELRDPEQRRGLTLWVDRSYPYLMSSPEIRCPTCTAGASPSSR